MQAIDLTSLSTADFIREGRKVIGECFTVSKRALRRTLRRQASRHDSSSGSRRKAA